MELGKKDSLVKGMREMELGKKKFALKKMYAEE